MSARRPQQRGPWARGMAVILRLMMIVSAALLPLATMGAGAADDERSHD